MPIDASIPLQVRPFQTPQMPNLIDQYAKIEGIRATQAEIGLRQQEGAQNAAKAQREQQQFYEGQRKLEGDKALGVQLAQNTSTDAQGSPVVDYQAAAKNLAGAGFGDHARQVLAMGAADQKARLDAHKTQLENAKEQLALIGQSAGSALKAPDDKLQQSIDDERDKLANAGVDVSKVPTGMQMMESAGGDVSVVRNQLQQHLQAALTGDQQLTAQRADATLAADLADKKQKLLEGKIKTFQEATAAAGNLLSQATNQGQWDGIIKGLNSAGVPQEALLNFGPMYSPGAAQQAGRMGMTPTERQTAQHNALEEAQGAGRLAVEQANANIAAKTFEATYGAGADPALQGVDPKDRQAARKEASKAGEDYTKAQAVADNMQSVLDLARSGNKAAGSNLPLIGVETLNAINGIKRINSAEISQYQGAGSLLDKIKGRIGSLAVGQPIDADVLKDIESLHNQIRQNSGNALVNEVKRINGTHRASFDPEKLVGRPIQSGATASSIPTPSSQAEYNALPKGAQFKKPNDDKVYTKQ